MNFLKRIKAKKLLTDDDAIINQEPLATGDLSDAFQVLLFAVGLDEDPDPEFLNEVVETWNEALRHGKLQIFPLKKALSFSYFDHGRRTPKKYLNNPIIVAKVGQDMVVIDGSHRLLTRKESNLKDITAFVLELPYESLTNMEGQ